MLKCKIRDCRRFESWIKFIRLNFIENWGNVIQERNQKPRWIHAWEKESPIACLHILIQAFINILKWIFLIMIIIHRNTLNIHKKLPVIHQNVISAWVFLDRVLYRYFNNIYTIFKRVRQGIIYFCIYYTALFLDWLKK